MREVTVKTYYCDWCGEEIFSSVLTMDGGLHSISCVLCGRFACLKHKAKWRHGDFPEEPHNFCCNECWKIGGLFRTSIAALKTRIKKEHEKWKLKALANLAKAETTRIAEKRR